MSAFEQIPVESFEPTYDVKPIDKENKNVKGGGVEDQNSEMEQNPKKEQNPEEIKNDADSIVQDPESKQQIEELTNLMKKYEKKELKDEQRNQYEKLMDTIKEQLDRDVPTVIEMNNEIDINYYNRHPEEASNRAEQILNEYGNMNNVDLVGNVISRREYLSKKSKDKLDGVIGGLDKQIKGVLNNESTEK